MFLICLMIIKVPTIIFMCLISQHNMSIFRKNSKGILYIISLQDSPKSLIIRFYYIVTYPHGSCSALFIFLFFAGSC